LKHFQPDFSLNSGSPILVLTKKRVVGAKIESRSHLRQRESCPRKRGRGSSQQAWRQHSLASTVQTQRLEVAQGCNQGIATSNTQHKLPAKPTTGLGSCLKRRYPSQANALVLLQDLKIHVSLVQFQTTRPLCNALRPCNLLCFVGADLREFHP